jgi:hypothetical protein
MREHLFAWLTLRLWISFRYASKEFLGVRRDQVELGTAWRRLPLAINDKLQMKSV